MNALSGASLLRIYSQALRARGRRTWPFLSKRDQAGRTGSAIGTVTLPYAIGVGGTSRAQRFIGEQASPADRNVSEDLVASCHGRHRALGAALRRPRQPLARRKRSPVDTQGLWIARLAAAFQRPQPHFLERRIRVVQEGWCDSAQDVRCAAPRRRDPARCAPRPASFPVDAGAQEPTVQGRGSACCTASSGSCLPSRG